MVFRLTLIVHAGDASNAVNCFTASSQASLCSWHNRQRPKLHCYFCPYLLS